MRQGYGRSFWACVCVGGVVLGFGIGGLIVEGSRTHPDQWVRWFGGSLLVHDLVAAPIVFTIGALVVRFVPRRARGPVQAALIVSAVLIVVAYPAVRGYGARPDNPSVLPLDYGRNLLFLLGGVWATAALWTATRFSRKKTGDRDPKVTTE